MDENIQIAQNPWDIMPKTQEMHFVLCTYSFGMFFQLTK